MPGSSTRSSEFGDELKTSCCGAILLWLYRVLNCQRRWRIARVLIQVALRLEGGGMYSATARRMMADYHGVKIGHFSYGECFDPALVPPGVVIGRYVSIARAASLAYPLKQKRSHGLHGLHG